MSLQNPLLTQLYQLQEEEENRWKALFDDKFSEKDIRMLLLIYFYLKISGVYDHESNLFIISIQKFIALKHNTDIKDKSINADSEVQEFYKTCTEEETVEEDKTVEKEDGKIDKQATNVVTPKKEAMSQFIIETLEDNVHILNYLLDMVRVIIKTHSKKDVNMHIKCMIRHNIIEDGEKELQAIDFLQGLLAILEQSKEYIQILLKSKKNIVDTYKQYRLEYTSTVKDFIQDILLTTTHEELTMDTLLNIIRHSIYNFVFDFELIVPTHKYSKQVSLHTRLRLLLTHMSTVFMIMPFSLVLQFHNKVTSSMFFFIVDVEDIKQMSYYKSSSIVKKDYMTTFLDTLDTLHAENIVEAFCELYVQIYNGILDSVEYESSTYETSLLSVQPKYPSIKDVHKELKTYVCSLEPSDLLLFISDEDETQHKEHMHALFQKKKITDAILTSPSILVCMCNLKSNHTILLEDVLYVMLGLCDQKDSGVVHYVGSIDEALLSLHSEETTELKNIFEIHNEDEDYIQIDTLTAKTPTIEDFYMFYVECSHVSDIEHIKQTFESKPNMIQQISSDIISFKIY